MQGKDVGEDGGLSRESTVVFAEVFLLFGRVTVLGLTLKIRHILDVS